nr:MAG TPA: hypothetical protein [Caudoviricetes sp.]
MKRRQRSLRNWWLKTTSRDVLSTVCRVPLRLFSYVLTGLFVLSAASCSSTRQTVRSENKVSASAVRKDSASAATSVMKAWWTAPVKADTALLEIALDSGLWRLPEGASYAASSGRAHVKASVKQNAGGKPPTLVIESGCDSLARLCAYYEAENERLSVKNAHLQDSAQTAVEERSKERGLWWVDWCVFIAGGIVCTVITILTMKIYGKKCFRRN